MWETPDPPYTIEFTKIDVETVTKSLNPNKAQDCFMIRIRMLKTYGGYISRHI